MREVPAVSGAIPVFRKMQIPIFERKLPMKKIVFLLMITLVLVSGNAFADNKMPNNGITVIEEPPMSSSVSTSNESSYNGVTIFRTGPNVFDNFALVTNSVQFSACPLQKTVLSMVGANSTRN